jgi:hypothetical protein
MGIFAQPFEALGKNTHIVQTSEEYLLINYVSSNRHALFINYVSLLMNIVTEMVKKVNITDLMFH